ncbi:hypothetical protein PsorP6_013950 [Peronosclerospora sorghi]|uniref:Uncharacterized protein n=1 Tax=Peronosclerospora sorghi TaxID=230839 RepID=A0ACC0VFH3_9STRA|nr:hypothetical protein PsorP6_013950 [Peronosclerospora sorghi]
MTETIDTSLGRLPSHHEDRSDAVDHFLDVVVTSVDTNVTPSIASSLTLSDLSAFTVELVVTKGVNSYCIRRPLTNLIDVLGVIQSVPPLSNDSLPSLPEFPPKGHRNDSSLAQWCTHMTAYLAAHRCGLLQLHPDWLGFVTERDEDKGARMHMTAVDFILQPFPLKRIYVPRGAQHTVVLHVTTRKEDNDPHYLVWKFEVEDLDVDFGVSFAPEPYEQPVEIIHARTRYETTTGRAIEGFYRCLRPGKATFVWDNSYSRLRGKNILYEAQVVTSEVMDSATAAADALDEVMQAEKARDQERDLALSTALIPAPRADANAPSGYSAYIPEAIAQQSWLLQAPITVAGHLASKLFGSQEITTAMANGESSSEARSLLEELNGLNMQLMERMESHEDLIATLTAERDRERSKTHLASVDKENLENELKMKEQELASVASELQRMQREREAWREIQADRDALLEEKHRWAMHLERCVSVSERLHLLRQTDDFDGEESAHEASEMDVATRTCLEKELGQAEATVLRCRAELRYPLNNHLTGTSTRLERIARDMAATKQQYEEHMQTWEQERLQLTQELVKARGQRRVLVTEMRNMRTQAESQIAVAMAEASEARMVNKRLKKQNELLLTQIRTLINEAEENERKRSTERDDEQQPSQLLGDIRGQSKAMESNGELVETDQPSLDRRLKTENLNDHASHNSMETRDEEDHSTVPYTLNEDDIALLNGRPPPSARTDASDGSCRNRLQVAQPLSNASSESRASGGVSFRARLITFFNEHDPDKLPEVDEMLAIYTGVEEYLFQSLELKYSYMEINQRIAQKMTN